MDTIVTVFYLTFAFNTALVCLGLYWDWCVQLLSKLDINDVVSQPEIPQLPEWAIESLDQPEIECPEYNPFEEAVLAIDWDSLPVEADIANNNEFPVMVLTKGEPPVIVKATPSRKAPKTINGYWVDNQGKVRDAKGRFAKLPVSTRKAA